MGLTDHSINRKPALIAVYRMAATAALYARPEIV
jgi:hypothetical protein